MSPRLCRVSARDRDPHAPTAPTVGAAGEVRTSTAPTHPAPPPEQLHPRCPLCACAWVCARVCVCMCMCACVSLLHLQVNITTLKRVISDITILASLLYARFASGLCMCTFAHLNQRPPKPTLPPPPSPSHPPSLPPSLPSPLPPWSISQFPRQTIRWSRVPLARVVMLVGRTRHTA